MGLYKTQNRLEQSETLILFFGKNKFKVHFIKKKSCFILPHVSHSPIHPYRMVFVKKMMISKTFKNMSDIKMNVRMITNPVVPMADQKVVLLQTTIPH
jgi:hypothetical protein